MQVGTCLYKVKPSQFKSYRIFSNKTKHTYLDMKAVIVVLFALVALSQAQYFLGGLGYSAHFAPTIRTGYVAANPGAVHTAPLPQGPFAFSHHINTAPAAATFF